MNRICSVCKTEKPTSDFYQRKRSIHNQCKICMAKRTKRNYYLNQKDILTKKQEYYVENVETILKKRKIYGQTEESKSMRLLNKARMKIKYPEKFKARELALYAYKSGKIQKEPCIICGETKIQAHHNDYSKPYDVIFFCMRHHKLIHGKFKVGIDGYEQALLEEIRK